MEKINYLLGYNNIKIFQDTDWFNFSLDSILLPNFVKLKKNVKEILDIGSGNAVIPIILSTKTDASITGIEIQKDVYELGIKSLEFNNLQDRIKWINDDVKEFSKNQESDQYDLITCNPPYFKIDENSNINDDIHKQIARHEITLCLEDIIKIGRKLLKNGGSLVLVHRPERLIEIIETMRKNNIEPKRIRFVYPKQGKNANILLIEGVKDGSVGVKIEEPLYTYNENGNYTEEILSYFS